MSRVLIDHGKSKNFAFNAGFWDQILDLYIFDDAEENEWTVKLYNDQKPYIEINNDKRVDVTHPELKIGPSYFEFIDNKHILLVYNVGIEDLSAASKTMLYNIYSDQFSNMNYGAYGTISGDYHINYLNSCLTNSECGYLFVGTTEKRYGYMNKVIIKKIGIDNPQQKVFCTGSKTLYVNGFLRTFASSIESGDLKFNVYYNNKLDLYGNIKDDFDNTTYKVERYFESFINNEFINYIE